MPLADDAIKVRLHLTNSHNKSECSATRLPITLSVGGTRVTSLTTNVDDANGGDDTDNDAGRAGRHIPHNQPEDKCRSPVCRNCRRALGPKFGRLCANETAVALKSTANVKTNVFMIQSPISIYRRTGKRQLWFLNALRVRASEQWVSKDALAADKKGPWQW